MNDEYPVEAWVSNNAVNDQSLHFCDECDYENAGTNYCPCLSLTMNIVLIEPVTLTGNELCLKRLK
jgi:hypothetical protein